jgi:hypothetical protein
MDHSGHLKNQHSKFNDADLDKNAQPLPSIEMLG